MARSSPSRNSPVPLDLVALPGLPLDELRRIWPQHMGRTEPPSQKKVLVRELAWRVQERMYGGVDAQTKRLLDSAVRQAQQRRGGDKAGLKVAAAEADHRVDGEDAASSLPKRRKQNPSVMRAGGPLVDGALVTGARIVRVWPSNSSTKHEVVVLEHGKKFQYRGKVYASLSEVARTITGTHWSGPRFFGLASRRRDDGNGGTP